MQTAILSGDNTKELRIFMLEDLSRTQEKQLTKYLCWLMDRQATDWKKYVFYRLIIFPNQIIS